MLLTILIIQEAAWHRGGMFMGVHWAWWLFITFGVVVLLWGFVRLVADRAATKRDAARLRQAEAELRARFARGEINEEQLANQLTTLLGIGPARGAR